MIDTIKFGIPLSKGQHKKLLKLLFSRDSFEWAQINRYSGEIRFLRCRGLVNLDRESFHREVSWDIPETYRTDNTFLVVELSLPKFWYGHNIRLLYNFVDALRELKKIFEKQLHCRFIDVMKWQLFRVDVCYNWQCPNQETAQKLINSLKRFHFPRKQPVIYSSTVLFKGTTYSLKFYLKLPEFIKNDKDALLKENASLEWVNHLENLADGVIRCEAILRRRYLKRKNLLTVADLAKSKIAFQFDDHLIDLENMLNYHSKFNEILYMITVYEYAKNHNLDIEIAHYRFSCIPHPKDNFDIDNEENLLDIERYMQPYNDNKRHYAPEYEVIINGKKLSYEGGGYTTIDVDEPSGILSYFLSKFLGDYRGMDSLEVIEEKLLSKYKPARATKLIGFWLYVQKFGTEKAKAIFGVRSYYRCKHDLKEANVSLIEPLNLVVVDDEFLANFKFNIPSPFVTNKVDDFRDHENIVNLENYRHQRNLSND